VEKRLPAARAVIRIDITKTQKSCGYGVPIMQLLDERETLNKWGEGLTRKVHSISVIAEKDSNSSR
jgi:hypothetical protein